MVLLAGCGGGGRTTSSVDTSAQVSTPGGNGTLLYAIPAVPTDLDPLLARTREEKLISIQLHEPLVATEHPPYGRSPERAGLALSIHPSPNRTIWTANLRSNVRFHDGTRFNAAAVVANARRWASVPAGQALVPDLFATDTPRPDVVRFQLSRRDPGFGRRLASPQLGIVAPQSLRPRSGFGARVSGIGAAGTGPFELTGIDSNHIVLSRFGLWWGSSLGLGPALDGIEFQGNDDALSRLSELEAGDVQVADELPATSLARVAANPLLATLPGPEGSGISREVRGLDTATPIPFSGVWLTTIGAG